VHVADASLRVQSQLHVTSVKARSWGAGGAPLTGSKVAFVAASDTASGERVGLLAELVRLLGGSVAAPRACDVCVACNEKAAKTKHSAGGVQAPPNLRAGAHLVTDEWLLLTAERGERAVIPDFVVEA